MKVCILDKNGSGREQMLKFLNENKHIKSIEVFEDYMGLLERVGKAPPDFCMIRLGNDVIPGLKVAEMVRQINPDIRIIFLSEVREYALDAYEIGAYGYLLSPIEKSKLDNCLEIEKKPAS